jgi:hypothetical protein
VKKQIIKRIFVTGPAGSFWSSVDQRLRRALIHADNTDITPQRMWIKPNGEKTHYGAYFNKGNEFGDWITKFHKYCREEIVETLDSVFIPQPEQPFLIRLHKCHDFCLHLDQIIEQFPDAAIVTVNNDPHRCLHNWHKSGAFTTPYDKYPNEIFNLDYEHMWEEINLHHWTIKLWNRKMKLETSRFTKKFIQTNFKVPLNPKFANSKERVYDGVETLHMARDGSHGLIPTVEVSCYPWKTGYLTTDEIKSKIPKFFGDDDE